MMTEADMPVQAEEQETGAKQLLFNKWDISEAQITDPGLVRYVNLTSMIVPHSCGKLSQQQFAKSEMLIVERLINKLMQTENNTGKKQLTIRIVEDAFDKINKKTKKNPVQVLVDAISNAGPREETVRLKYGGINGCHPVAAYLGHGMCRLLQARHDHSLPVGHAPSFEGQAGRKVGLSGTCRDLQGARSLRSVAQDAEKGGNE